MTREISKKDLDSICGKYITLKLLNREIELKGKFIEMPCPAIEGYRFICYSENNEDIESMGRFFPIDKTPEKVESLKKLNKSFFGKEQYIDFGSYSLIYIHKDGKYSFDPEKTTKVIYRKDDLMYSELENFLNQGFLF